MNTKENLIRMAKIIQHDDPEFRKNRDMGVGGEEVFDVQDRSATLSSSELNELIIEIKRMYKLDDQEITAFFSKHYPKQFMFLDNPKDTLMDCLQHFSGYQDWEYFMSCLQSLNVDENLDLQRVLLWGLPKLKPSKEIIPLLFSRMFETAETWQNQGRIENDNERYIISNYQITICSIGQTASMDHLPSIISFIKKSLLSQRFFVSWVSHNNCKVISRLCV